MKEVSLIILRNNHRLLMYLRDNKSAIPYPNYWSLIGGGIEENETPYEALVREIDEEIGCKIENIVKIHELIDNIGSKIFLFKGDISEEINNINLTEGQRLGYFTLLEFRNLKVPSVLKEYILQNSKELFRI